MENSLFDLLQNKPLEPRGHFTPILSNAASLGSTQALEPFAIDVPVSTDMMGWGLLYITFI